MTRSPLVAILAAFTCGWLACSSFQASGGAEATDGGAPEAAAATCATACGANESCSNGQCVLGCPNGVVFVSSAGSDQNTGCDQTKPKATINGALGYVKTLGLTRHEIHVCAGTYTENGVTLDYPVTLRGGYECSLWQRHTPFAWTGIDPTTGGANFDLTNETIIDAGSAPTALTVSGPTVDQATTVEGFTIRGNATAGGTALLLTSGTSAFITNDQILGSAAGPSSIGVALTDTASSEITNAVIRGGSGGVPTGTGAGSTGILVGSSGIAPSIHDNQIGSGDGTSSVLATVAVDIEGTTPLTGARALRNNAIFFEGTIATAQVASFGVLVAGTAQVDVVGNGIYGQGIGCTLATCSGHAIFVAGSGSTVVGNRIVTGNGAQSPIPPDIFGIQVDVSTTNVLIANNLMALEPANFANAVGIIAPSSASAIKVEHNTIIVPAGAAADGISVRSARANVDDNLIIGARTGFLGVSGPCMDGPTTTGYPPLTLNNNAFVAVGTDTSALMAPAQATDACGGAQGANRIGTFESLFPPGTATGNVALAASCDGDTACHTCTNADCLADIFNPALDFTEFVSAKVTFAPTVTCMLAKGGGSDVTTVPTDILGVARTNPTTIGATEDDGACMSP